MTSAASAAGCSPRGRLWPTELAMNDSAVSCSGASFRLQCLQKNLLLGAWEQGPIYAYT